MVEFERKLLKIFIYVRLEVFLQTITAKKGADRK
jgi:hypothetical protein